MPCPGRRACVTAYSVHRRLSTRAGAVVVLRPYQEACLDACVDSLKAGSTRIGVSLPTGSGKTTVFISLLSRLSPPPQAPHATRSLIVVNNIELVEQTANQVQRLFPRWSVEMEQGKHNASGLADVTVATYQTLLQAHRVAKFQAQYLKAVIIDEAHHAAAPSYRRLLSHFHPAIQHPDPMFVPPDFTHPTPILGFSATFSRHDGLALGSVFERIVYHRDFLEMIKEQWLCNVRFTTVQANIDLTDVTVNARTGDFNATSLAHVINTDTVNELVVRTWLDKAADRKSTLVFCVNLSHVSNLTAKFREAGIDARYVHAKTPAAERKALIEAFRAGQYPVLVNCAILTEGTDVPNIDCVMLARPTRSRNVFAQMIGRGMRLSPGTGKADCRIIDFVQSTERIDGIVSIPSIFGLDPSMLSDDETVESLERLRAQLNQNALQGMEEDLQDDREYTSINVPKPRSVTYIDYDDPFSLVYHASGDPYIGKMSSNAWVCSGEKYVLECMGKGFVRIERAVGEPEDGPKFHAYFVPVTMTRGTAFHLKISPFRRSKKILSAATLSEAVRGCDTYVLNEVCPGQLGLGLLRGAKWRRESASDTQKKFILQRWKGWGKTLSSEEFKRRREEEEPGFRQMTKGEAANMITRLKHGALARYEKKLSGEMKVVVALQKEKSRKAREHVKVGPLPVH